MKEPQSAEQQTQKRILILCVDRDADIETKAGIKTPIVGRTANLDSAVSLALKDPEEADANAMFESVRLIDRLQQDKKPEETFEVATVSGSELGGVSADRKLVDELNRVIDSFSATEVILVTDGFTDEAILPLVQSRVPVSSVRRVVIKHSESIEETAAVFTKYFRMLFNDPRYSRIALGIPGLLFLLYGILALTVSGFTLQLYGLAIVIVHADQRGRNRQVCERLVPLGKGILAPTNTRANLQLCCYSRDSLHGRQRVPRRNHRTGLYEFKGFSRSSEFDRLAWCCSSGIRIFHQRHY
jgi:hypothetical protein